MLEAEDDTENGYFVDVDFEYTDTTKTKRVLFPNSANLKKLTKKFSLKYWKVLCHLTIGFEKMISIGLKKDIKLHKNDI